jgi:S1-C subfamily serine protease
VRLTIGRAAENSLVISDDSVSGYHASIESIDGFQTLVDLGSSNGTFVNGTRVGRHLLEVGDEVKFGETQFVWNGSELRVRPTSPQSEFLRNLPPPENTVSLLGSKRPKKKLLIGGFVGIGLIGLLAGIAVSVDTEQTSITADELAKRTVYVSMENSNGDECWSGSGAVVLDGTYVLTNEHVSSLDTSDADLADCTELKIGIVERSSDKPSKFFDVSVVESSEFYDLALLKIDLENSEPLTPFQVREEELGLDVPVRVIGFPGLGGGTITLTSGVISGTDDRESADFYKVSATINKGNSGGPVVDSEGNLVGIATALRPAGIDCTEDNCVSSGTALGLARPIKYALPFLRKYSQ